MCRAAEIPRRKVVQHDFYDTAEQVAGVVLLNSPSNASWEYEDYLRLLCVKRYSWKREDITPAALCCFVCADGAYSRLRAYVDEQQQQQHQSHLRQFTVFPLCDAIIGDMDSYTSSHVNDGSELPSLAPAEGFATMEDIPVEILDDIHHRRQSATDKFVSLMEHMAAASSLADWEKLREQSRNEASFSPLRLHVSCQFTTDFEKSLLLLRRLRDRLPEAAVIVPPPVLCSPSGMKLLESGGNIILDTKEGGCDHDPKREHDLCAEATLAEVVLLPTYVVIGAFGGRFDHEMGAVSVMLSFSRGAHVVLTNAFNTVFACQPNGWTQIVWQSQHEDLMCGLINYGVMKQCETSGLLWNVVHGRGKQSVTRDMVFGFGNFLSLCNTVRHEVVTVDLRHLLPERNSSISGGMEDAAAKNNHDGGDGTACDDNPPTIFSIQRRIGKK